ncbi:LacI family DNA-binding transcriptional regulator [Pseudoponticoccus marisrubri]|uniref:HTH lacI-type domain-containing protein n=1 Tax=Pseudoponticoccus marisrubri TaxID=1685382 RepID=A0A0W7WH37_9RHOB|nr:LacI family DNA-binding transcriptional regulator [Pseudoponticoccus marisrubri]KUF09877.1 hypothetical protein AVJ23_15665 [Pseudoponticoccus marisrubri]
MPTRVTIKSIARDLGISHMTVSRALSNHPNVQKETREAVLKRAEELGYVRSAAATAMRGDRMRIVGLLLPNIVNEFYARFADTMAMACEEAALHLTIHLTRDDIDAETQALRRLQELQARAVVMVPTPGQSQAGRPHLQAMRVLQLIRERDIGQPVPTVQVDDAGAIRDAVLHLAAAGHRRIGYIGATPALSSGRVRLAAYRTGLAAAGLSEEAPLVITGAPTAETGRAGLHRLLESATATVCGGFEISNGALIALLSAGQRPDGPFGFVGYGDPSFYSWIGAGVSTVSIPVDALAHCAVELLQEDAPAPERHAFTARFVAR